MKKRIRKSKVRIFYCIDCNNAFKGKEGCNSKYCESCRVVSCICKGCGKEFSIKRKDYNDGRGIYCCQKCYLKNISKSIPHGEKNGMWKNGITIGEKIKEYHKLHRENNRDKYVAYGENRRSLFKNAIGSHTGEEWEELKKKYDYMCLCCKQQEPLIKLTEDHIIPLSKGGSNYIFNIQPLCLNCNSIKYTKIINFTKEYELV